jgi:hypothetical protein
MNFKKLPKQEEVTDFDLGGLKASVVELTDENRPHVLEAVLSMYMDDKCMYCRRNFSYEEVKKSVVAHENPYGRIVHKECWDANN